ncbi:lysine decarboxylase, putative [Plasmodium vinckei vinckei]|uniref:Lysine decarboxylase, putative n=1 Tax=Plasmodium vinckei vinckei TaxID=54757 RepID=A0A449BR57_PLAVN|nr:lysine decarboxylase, putative [Plasmodium vinckei vinckei]VEV55878.1 lysine decarboxylase, putative [Plasmodium vinckei vinckei]
MYGNNMFENRNTENDYMNTNNSTMDIDTESGVYLDKERKNQFDTYPFNLKQNKSVILKRMRRRNKYENIDLLEKYININNATNVCSLRIKLWEALMLYVNKVNVELIYFIINCLEEIEVYWGEEAKNALQDIISLINDKKYKEVSNKIGEILSSLSVTSGKVNDDSQFFYTLIVSGKREEYHNNNLNINNNNINMNTNNNYNSNNNNSNYFNSDLSCELNKFLQYEQNRFSNQNNNKKLEYKIVEVNNAKEALLACLINPQILSVVLVDNLIIDDETKNDSNNNNNLFFNFNDNNSLNKNYIMNYNMPNNFKAKQNMCYNNVMNNGGISCGASNNDHTKMSEKKSRNSRDGINSNDGETTSNNCINRDETRSDDRSSNSSRWNSARNNTSNIGDKNLTRNRIFLKNDYKFDIGDFVLGYDQLVSAPLEKMKKGYNSLVILIKSIAYIRSSVDIFCVCTSITLDKLRSVNNKIIRIFTTHDDHSDLHESILDGVKKKIKTPFFNALKLYAERPIGVFHALAISKGNSVRRSRWIQSLLDFYGVNLFKAESSATCGGLDSLLDPHGSLKEAQIMAARAYGSKYCFFVTNGTSSSNKIVMQALVKPGDIILVDRACHKSHHYGFVLCQALPCYLDPYPISRYGIYGAIPIYVIKKTLLEYRNSNKLHLVKMIILTNCTFDGIVYNVKRVMEECLAIKSDLIFLFDEAWFAYACFHPILKFRTAMAVAEKMRSKEHKKLYYKIHNKLLKKFGNVKSLNDVPSDTLLKTRLYPNPAEYKVRVYATQSIHKSLTSLRQGSVILISDDNFESDAYTPFKEAYYTHMSTSPNYQILATLDAGRAQMELEGYGLVEKQVEAAFLIRRELSEDPMISRYFRILNEDDLIPDSLRQCCIAYMNAGNTNRRNGKKKHNHRKKTKKGKKNRDHEKESDNDRNQHDEINTQKQFLMDHDSYSSRYNSANASYSCISSKHAKGGMSEPLGNMKCNAHRNNSNNIPPSECINQGYVGNTYMKNKLGNNVCPSNDLPNNGIISNRNNGENEMNNFKKCNDKNDERNINGEDTINCTSNFENEQYKDRKMGNEVEKTTNKKSINKKNESYKYINSITNDSSSNCDENTVKCVCADCIKNENIDKVNDETRSRCSDSESSDDCDEIDIYDKDKLCSKSNSINNFLEYFECSWLSEDEFVLDPTRITLFTGYSGIDGDTFKVKWLMDKYGIQINKTSINSVLFQTNIGTTGSSCLFLKSCLSLISQELDQKKTLFNERDLNHFNESVYNLVYNYIELSQFSDFHPLFKKKYKDSNGKDSNIFNREGDLRKAFYLAYEEDYVEYILMADLKERVKHNEMVVSASFIIPYPPGFPVLVPGQIISNEILNYLSGLSVKEIHGYDENIGFRCFYNFILNYFDNVIISDPYGYYQKIDKKLYDKLKHESLRQEKQKNIENSYYIYVYDNQKNRMKKLYLFNGNTNSSDKSIIADNFMDDEGASYSIVCSDANNGTAFTNNNTFSLVNSNNMRKNTRSHSKNINNNVTSEIHYRDNDEDMYKGDNKNINIIPPNFISTKNKMNNEQESFCKTGFNQNVGKNYDEKNIDSINFTKTLDNDESSTKNNLDNMHLASEKKKIYGHVLKKNSNKKYVLKGKEIKRHYCISNEKKNNKYNMLLTKMKNDGSEIPKNEMCLNNNSFTNMQNHDFDHKTNRLIRENYFHDNTYKKSEQNNNDFDSQVNMKREDHYSVNADNNIETASTHYNKINICNNEESKNPENMGNHTKSEFGNAQKISKNINCCPNNRHSSCLTNESKEYFNKMSEYMQGNHQNTNTNSLLDMHYMKKFSKFNKSDDGKYNKKSNSYCLNKKMNTSNIIMDRKITKNDLLVEYRNGLNGNDEKLNNDRALNNYVRGSGREKGNYSDYSNSSKRLNKTTYTKRDGENIQKEMNNVTNESSYGPSNKLLNINNSCFNRHEENYNNDNEKENCDDASTNYVTKDMQEMNEGNVNTNNYSNCNCTNNDETENNRNCNNIKCGQNNNRNQSNTLCCMQDGECKHVDGNSNIGHVNISNVQVKNEIKLCVNNFHINENDMQVNSIIVEKDTDKNSIRKLNTLNNNSYINNLITNVDDDTYIHKEGNFFLECALTNSEINCSSFDMDISLNNAYGNEGNNDTKECRNYEGDKKNNF